MPIYKITCEFEKTFEAVDENEAMAKMEEDLCNANESLDSYLAITETNICPDCEEPLQIKMIDLDGTNVEERQVCEKCGFGYPEK